MSTDIEGVLSLFTDDAVYYETPFQQLDGNEAIRDEWETVREQEDITLDFQVFNREGRRYTVQWELEYRENGEKKQYNGVYLIILNSNGKCEEFWQYAAENPG